MLGHLASSFLPSRGVPRDFFGSWKNRDQFWKPFPSIEEPTQDLGHPINTLLDSLALVLETSPTPPLPRRFLVPPLTHPDTPFVAKEGQAPLSFPSASPSDGRRAACGRDGRQASCFIVAITAAVCKKSSDYVAHPPSGAAARSVWSQARAPVQRKSSHPRAGVPHLTCRPKSRKIPPLGAESTREVRT